MKPQLVKCSASVFPNCFCQFGAVFASDTGQTIAVSVVKFTLAHDTCGCPLTYKVKKLFMLASKECIETIFSFLFIFLFRKKNRERDYQEYTTNIECQAYSSTQTTSLTSFGGISI